jgi:hypothetical protein
MLAYNEQFKYLNFWFSLIICCSLRIWRIRITAINKGKLRGEKIPKKTTGKIVLCLFVHILFTTSSRGIQKNSTACYRSFIS